MLTFYRVLVILFCFSGMAVAITHEFSQPFLKFLTVLGLSVAMLTLLLFANMVADVRNVRNRDEPIGFSFMGGSEELSQLLGPQKSAGLYELGNLPVRDVGDRRFKADATKVCKTCKFVDEDNRKCRKDNISLEGITISAVGCQYWTLGLTVTETPEGDSSDQGPEEDNEQT
ncbi:MAG: hypothetical protein KC944_07800 [Candidatus Omnitrophica bacterium]|nr:hypothetical protein [Candidatus Omnitrophota bacterium]